VFTDLFGDVHPSELAENPRTKMTRDNHHSQGATLKSWRNQSSFSRFLDLVLDRPVQAEPNGDGVGFEVEVECDRER